MCRKYDDNIIGQVMEVIVEHHKDKDILYKLNEEAEGIFEVITDKLNDQFNLKYTSSSQISASQPSIEIFGINIRQKYLVQKLYNGLC